jgi:DNA-binding NarL/FixJ family response regulator
LAHTILIVDDSPAMRYTLRSYLSHHAEWHICGEAENGQEAVEKVKKLSPDVVILDFQMPVMNGLEAARAISQLAPDTAMLMLTMHHGKELLEEAHAVGIEDVLSKSDAVADHLLASLRKVCSSS